MKNIRTIKIMAFAAALGISASMLAGCANKNPDEQGGADQSVTQTESAVRSVVGMGTLRRFNLKLNT